MSSFDKSHGAPPPSLAPPALSRPPLPAELRSHAARASRSRRAVCLRARRCPVWSGPVHEAFSYCALAASARAAAPCSAAGPPKHFLTLFPATATKGGPFSPSVTARKAAAFSQPPRSETPEVSWAAYAYSTEAREAQEHTAYAVSKMPTGGATGSMAEAMSPRGPYFPRGGHSAVKTEGPAPFSTYANLRVQMLDSGILRMG